MISLTPKEALEAQLAKLLEDFPPVVCFGNDIEGDPTSKHHIMRILARYVPVAWVESAGMRIPSLTMGDLRRIAHRLRRAAVPPREDGMRVLSPLGLPFPGNLLAERINARTYAKAVATALKGHAQPPLLWVYIPTVAPYLARIPNSGIVYHCVDRWWAFSEYDESVMRRHHEALCRSAVAVFASSEELLRECRKFAPAAQLLPHGVDWDHFSRAAAGDLPAPADVADLNHPIIGFFGLLHDWIDQDLIVETARALPKATILLIGKARVDLGRVLEEPNVHWIGQKPYSELPAYAAHFDVAIIPFIQNDLTAAVNPLKLLEYLAAGVPVVATALPEVVKLSDRPDLLVAQSRDDFVKGVVERARVQRTREQRIRTAQAEIGESWLGRCVGIVGKVREQLAGALTSRG